MAGRAGTRARLLEAATTLLARRGLREASIDQIADEAGYTKGAFYANFASKEELFLAMLDERFQQRADDLSRSLGTDDDPPELQARRTGDEFVASVVADPEWQRLFFEFAAHAARNEPFRVELVARYQLLRGHMAALYRRRADELGLALPVTADELALMTFALGNGVAMERLLEPDAVPEDLLGRMLEIWVAGLRALSGEAGESSQSRE